MGCCNSAPSNPGFQEIEGETLPPHKANLSFQNVRTQRRKEKTLDPQTKQMIQTLSNKFQIIKCIQKRLQKVTYSSSGLSYLADAVINTAISFDIDREGPHDYSMINDLFTPKITHLIKQNSLYYEDLKAMIQKKKTANASTLLDKDQMQKLLSKVDGKITQARCSRLYYSIANIKKPIELKFKYQNKFKVKCELDNSYKSLSEDQISQVIALEVIADHIGELGKKIDFRLKAISEESDQVINLLNTIFKDQEKTIRNLKYDLQEKEVLEVARISRQGCDYYDDAVYLLLLYFIKAWKLSLKNNKQSQGQIVNTLQNKMEELISKLSELYPPGKKLEQSDEVVRRNLESLEMKGERKGKFEHEPIELKGNDRSQLLQNIIVYYAQLAKNNKEDFEKLIRTTCLDKCISFKLGLKLNPDNPNPKAVIRIQEKMLLKKEEEGKRQIASSMKDIFEGEQVQYQEKLKHLLSTKENITFAVSDMIRAKCIFLNIEDIIETVRKIKMFTEKNSQTFRIVEIDSRFNNPKPISDVTLKIVLNEAIVAELQLTLQTNAPTYNFSHKIYELQRAKIFSKIKMVDNYYQQYRKEFSQLVFRSLKLQKEGQYVVDRSLHAAIQEYFEMDKIEMPDLPQFLGSALESASLQRKSKIEMKECQVAGYQQLMLVLFQMHMQASEWQGMQKDKYIGELSNNIFKNSKLSVILKSVLLQSIYKNIQLIALYPRLKVFANQYAQIQTENKKLNGWTSEVRGIFMEEYLNYYFKIDPQTQKLFSKETAKTLYFTTRINNFLQAIIEWDVRKEVFVFKCLDFGSVVVDSILSEMSEENISFIHQTASLLLNQGKYEQSQKCINWLRAILQTIPLHSTLNIREEAQLLQARLSFKIEHFFEATSTLKKIKEQFKSKEQFRKVAQCDLWLLLCSLKSGDNLEQYRKSYQTYQKFCGAHCLQLKGAECAEQEWLIAQTIRTNNKDTNTLKNVLKTHYGKALAEFSVFLPGSDFLLKMRGVWGLYKTYNTPQPVLGQNRNIITADLSPTDQKEVEWLVKNCLKRWPNLEILRLSSETSVSELCQWLSDQNWGHKLTHLSLGSNQIDNNGCSYLSSGKWPSLTYLNLDNNNISDAGCQQLSKVKWTQLTQLSLERNQIQAKGCLQLTKSKWTHLTQLNLNSNYIGPEGCLSLSQSQWPHLTQLYLGNNNIQSEGCEALIKSNWPQLAELNLGWNNIDAEGCLHLSKINWSNLTLLYLGKNTISDKGCLHLSNAKWPNLLRLLLDYNNIKAEGCEHLSNGKWPRLTQLSLGQNRIGDKGCENLSKAKWPSLSQLSLELNTIGDEGCSALKNADWPSLTLLHLGQNSIGDTGCFHLRHGKWSNLRLLLLDNNSITDKGCLHLRDAANVWPNLRRLTLYSNNVANIGSAEKTLQNMWIKASIEM